MKTRIVLTAVAALISACSSKDGKSDAERETPLQVASRPFTIGNAVDDQMGTHVGDMGTDREGDPSLNALAEMPDEAADDAVPADGSAADANAGESQFTTEGGPEV